MVKPNFFIVGAPKAGTTSLYNYLEEHPDIYMSSIKETNFFSYEEIKAQNLFYNEEYINTEIQYLSLFKNAVNEKAIGEASVSYLFYPTVPSKIKAFNPEAKIILVLRNPVERGFSHYLMDKRLGFVKIPFEDIVKQKTSHKKLHLYYQQYISLGLYYEQIKRYADIFSPEQMKILYFEDIINKLPVAIKSLYEFLDVDQNFLPDTNKAHNTFENTNNVLIQKLYTQKKVRTLIKTIMPSKIHDAIKHTFFSINDKPKLSPELKEVLIKIYRNDINRISSLLKKDLSCWLK